MKCTKKQMEIITFFIKKFKIPTSLIHSFYVDPPPTQLAFFCAQYGFFGKTIEQDARYTKAWKHVDNQESLEGLHALGEAQLAGEKFDKALGTYQKAIRIAGVRVCDWQLAGPILFIYGIDSDLFSFIV